MAFGTQSGQPGSLHRPQADINVTPLVDVMLVLLIVFMITAPMLASGLKVDLPQAKAAQPVNPKDPVVVTVTRDGKLSVDGDDVELAGLINTLQIKTQGDTSRVIQIKSDKEANYGTVVSVIDQLASNGMVHIALISDRKPADAGLAPESAPAQTATRLASTPRSSLATMPTASIAAPAQTPAPAQGVAPAAP